MSDKHVSDKRTIFIKDYEYTIEGAEWEYVTRCLLESINPEAEQDIIRIYKTILNEAFESEEENQKG